VFQNTFLSGSGYYSDYANLFDNTDQLNAGFSRRQVVKMNPCHFEPEMKYVYFYFSQNLFSKLEQIGTSERYKRKFSEKEFEVELDAR
jgi:hypothetical protein